VTRFTKPSQQRFVKRRELQPLRILLCPSWGRRFEFLIHRRSGILPRLIPAGSRQDAAPTMYL
jgi:hypothetical protein